MWERYRKTALVTQIFIFVCCAIVAFVLHKPWTFTLTAFVMMQAGAVGGAYWSTRLIRKIEEDARKK